jgi:putative ABC transport system permease protein
MKLFEVLILRPLGRDPLRTALTVISVALGIAVMIAIQLASEAATGSFRSSMEALVGKTDLEIRANGGVDEQWMGRLDALPFDVRFSPFMEAQANIAGVGAVALYGVDALGLAENAGGTPQAILSRALAERLGMQKAAPQGVLAASIEGRPQAFRVARIDRVPGEFVAIDVADFQRILGRYGKLDHIDATFGQGEDAARAAAAIRAALPASYLVEQPGARSQESLKMVRAFRWNLRMLSDIALVVGAFLIYNTIAISVVRRRAEIGIVRALGAGRGTVLGIFLAEALLLGIGGAALGLVLGRVLAGLSVGMIADTVNALYTTSRPAPVELTWGDIWGGLATGAVVAWAAAWGPAREAMAVAPTEAMSRGAHEHRARLRWRRSLAWAAASAALAAALSQVRPLGGYPVGAYAAALAWVAAAAFTAPALVLAAHRAMRPLLGRRVESLLAGRSLAASLPRTSVVVAALATAIAMMASVGLMVGSFRETVLVWLDVQLRADLYVRAAAPLRADDYAPIPPRALAAIAGTPGVAAVDDYHALPVTYDGERATLGAGNIEIERRYGRLRFLPGPGGAADRDRILRSLAASDRAIVSEPFANKHGIRAGDRVALSLGERTARLLVAGVYYDYSSSQGYVIVDRSTLFKYLPGQPATNAAVYLKPGADAERVRRELQLRTAGMGVAIAANRELRRNSMAVFDRTFAITWALEAVALVVAMLGAANSLLALVLDRRRELGLLRYLGASSAQIRGMVLTEAGLLGLFAAALGLALGFALSLLLIFVVNKQSFGWTIQFHPPGKLLGAAVLAVWCATVLAALYPARIATRLSPVEVIHEE